MLGLPDGAGDVGVSGRNVFVDRFRRGTPESRTEEEAMSSHLIVHYLQTYAAVLMALRLLTGLVGAWMTYRIEIGGAKQFAFGDFVRYCLPRKLWTMQSVRFDAYFFLLSRVSNLWLFAAAVAAAAVAMTSAYGIMTALFGVHAQNPAHWPAQIVLILVYLGLRDFGEFASHVIMHRYDFLWAFHKVHHSSLLLTPLGAKRAHVVEDAIRIIPNAVVIATAAGVLSYVFSLVPGENAMFGVLSYGLFNILSFEVLRHSHIPLSFGKVERYLMSPLQHHVHHKREGVPQNFGSFLACWDRAYGTFTESLPSESFQIGLQPAEQSNYNSFAALCVKPFTEAVRALQRPVRSGQPSASSDRQLSGSGERGFVQSTAVNDKLDCGLQATG